jgi:NADH-ubiquinone oxidoreductase chain 4
MLTLILLIPMMGLLILVVIDETTSSGADQVKKVTLFTTVVTFIFSVVLWLQFDPSSTQYQLVQDYTTIGFIHLHVGVDGISLYYVILTTLLTPVCILAS